MNFTRDRVRSIGWIFVLAVCAVLTVGLMVRVNAVKSQVRLAERQLVSLKREKIFLATEFETRANQQQLRAINDVEFGYAAPTAGQYLASERQLAALGKPAAADAPAPVRVARAMSPDESGPFAGMVSPLTGKALAAEPTVRKAVSPAPGVPRKAQSLDARLTQLASRETAQE